MVDGSVFLRRVVLSNSDSAGAGESFDKLEGVENSRVISESESNSSQVISEERLKILELETKLGEANIKAAENYDRMLRFAADFENSRRRWEKEKLETRLYSISDFARDLLPVIDVFEKTLVTLDQQMESSAAENLPSLNSITEGVQLAAKSFYEALKKHGIEKLPGKGEPFNPDYHNAVAKIVDATLNSETVVEEFVAGYKIGERVLRTSMVKVGSPD